jgi:hypothetical protein
MQTAGQQTKTRLSARFFKFYLSEVLAIDRSTFQTFHTGNKLIEIMVIMVLMMNLKAKQLEQEKYQVLQL